MPRPDDWDTVAAGPAAAAAVAAASGSAPAAAEPPTHRAAPTPVAASLQSRLSLGGTQEKAKARARVQAGAASVQAKQEPPASCSSSVQLQEPEPEPEPATEQQQLMPGTHHQIRSLSAVGGGRPLRGGTPPTSAKPPLYDGPMSGPAIDEQSAADILPVAAAYSGGTETVRGVQTASSSLRLEQAVDNDGDDGQGIHRQVTGNTFAKIFEDDEMRDGCTQCPPTWKATRIFMWHLAKALFPFFFASQLFFRWLKRKFHHGPPKRDGETPREMADCLEWFYLFFLVYLVMTHSSTMHAWVKEWTDTLGQQEHSGWKAFLGADPYDQSQSFVDGALSESFFPLLAYILLAVLWAHEETSYPRRAKMQYSMEENSSSLLILLQWIKNNGEKQKIKIQCAGVILSFLGIEVFIFYWLQFGLPNKASKEFFGLGDSIGMVVLCICCGVAALVVGCVRWKSEWIQSTSPRCRLGLKVVTIILTWFSLQSMLIWLLAKYALNIHGDDSSLQGWSTWLTTFGMAVWLGSALLAVAGIVIFNWTTDGVHKKGTEFLDKVDRVQEDIYKHSFGGEKYTERYNRRFRELQCTPIQDFHFASKENNSWQYGQMFHTTQAPFFVFFRTLVKPVPGPKHDDIDTKTTGTDPIIGEILKTRNEMRGIKVIDDVVDGDRVQQENEPTATKLYAHQVSTMILHLSKARQLKKRRFWNRKLLYISIVHALIPSIYAFVYTHLWVAVRTIAILGIVFGITRIKFFSPDVTRKIQQDYAVKHNYWTQSSVLHDQAQQELSNKQAKPADPQRESLLTARQKVTELQEIMKKNSVIVQSCTGRLRLKARFLLKLVVGLTLFGLLLAGCIDGHNQSPDIVSDPKHVDQCGDILDTQGHCCCSVRVLDAQNQRVKLEDTGIWTEIAGDGNEQCCDSEFVPGGKLVKPQGTRSCRTPATDCWPPDQIQNNISSCVDDPGFQVPGGADTCAQMNAAYCSQSKPMMFQGLNKTAAQWCPLSCGTCTAPDKSASTKICINQEWLDNSRARLGFFEVDSVHSAQQSYLAGKVRKATIERATIAGWCSRFTDETATHFSESAGTNTSESLQCSYAVSSAGQSACSVPFIDVTHEWFLRSLLPREDPRQKSMGCLACGSTITAHFCNFLANTALTYAVVLRLYRCYEDYFLQYHRMLYCLQLVPWATMASILKEKGQGDDTLNKVVLKHENWGLLPTFDLSSASNIAAWNKLRLFMATYELRASRRLQVSVVYLLAAWASVCVYQSIKFVRRAGESTIDTEAIFVLSSTLMLAVGLAAILFTGKKINDISQIGFPHALRVKQAELLDKTSNFLVEYDFFHGKTLHDSREMAAGVARACDCNAHKKHDGAHGFDPYDDSERALLRAINTKDDPASMETGGAMSPLNRQDSRVTTELKQKYWKAESDARQQILDDQIQRGYSAAHSIAASTMSESADARGLSADQLQERRMVATHRWQLLESLIHTIEAEYGEGSRKHWGAEDRRAQLWFIVMTEGAIKGFATALLSGVAPFVIHALERALSYE